MLYLVVGLNYLGCRMLQDESVECSDNKEIENILIDMYQLEQSVASTSDSTAKNTLQEKKIDIQENLNTFITELLAREQIYKLIESEEPEWIIKNFKNTDSEEKKHYMMLSCIIHKKDDAVVALLPLIDFTPDAQWPSYMQVALVTQNEDVARLLCLYFQVSYTEEESYFLKLFWGKYLYSERVKSNYIALRLLQNKIHFHLTKAKPLYEAHEKNIELIIKTLSVDKYADPYLLQCLKMSFDEIDENTLLLLSAIFLEARFVLGWMLRTHSASPFLTSESNFHDINELDIQKVINNGKLETWESIVSVYKTLQLIAIRLDKYDTTQEKVDLLDQMTNNGSTFLGGLREFISDGDIVIFGQPIVNSSPEKVLYALAMLRFRMDILEWLFGFRDGFPQDEQLKVF